MKEKKTTHNKLPSEIIKQLDFKFFATKTASEISRTVAGLSDFIYHVGVVFQDISNLMVQPAGDTPPCTPALCTDGLKGSVDNVNISKFTKKGLNGKDCPKLVVEATIKSKVEKALKEKLKDPIVSKCCESCKCEKLVDLDKKKITINRHMTIYTDDATFPSQVEKKEDASCQADFDVSFDLTLSGPLGICIPAAKEEKKEDKKDF